MLSYQGKVVSVDRDEKLDAAEQMDADHDADDVLDHGDDAHTGGEFDVDSTPESHGRSDIG